MSAGLPGTLTVVDMINTGVVIQLPMHVRSGAPPPFPAVNDGPPEGGQVRQE